MSVYEQFFRRILGGVTVYANRLQCIQEAIDKIADGIYNQNIIRSRELKVQVLNIGCVREDIERAAELLEQNGHNAQHTQAKMPSWGDVTKGITFSTVGERDIAAEVFSRVARHFGCA